MAIDLSLTIVPKQIGRLFGHANWDREYAQLICFIPSILKRSDFFRYRRTQTDLDFERDALELKRYREYSQADFYYDSMRGSATLDWLFSRLAEAWGIYRFPRGFLRSNDDDIAKLASKLAFSVQGFPVRYFDRSRLEPIFEFMNVAEFNDLMDFYDFDEMCRARIYKLTGPHRLDFLREAFADVLALYSAAQRDENTYVLQVLH